MNMLCRACFGRLAAIRIRSPMCHLCGRPFSGETPQDCGVCLKCRIRRPRFDAARSIFPYRGPAGEVIKAFKYAGQYYLGPALLKRAIESSWFPDDAAGCEAVAAVPLHWRQRHKRGYNQAELLGKTAARYLSRPFMPGMLRRVRHTVSQTQLAAWQREKNVRGAFRVRRKKMPDSVLLVDDVLTTGSTANECAKVLKRGGCSRVTVLTLLRAAV